MSFQKVFLLCLFATFVSRASAGWGININYGPFDLTYSGVAAPSDPTPSHRIAACSQNRFIASNGTNTHMLLNGTVDYSYNREARCLRVSDGCTITALKSNETISVFQGQNLRCQINHSWVWNNFALSSDGSLIANPQCDNTSTFEVAFYNNQCEKAYPSVSLAVPCSSVYRTSFRKFFKNNTKLLAHLVKTDNVSTHDNKKSYVFIIALKNGKFQWQEVLTFNGDTIQTEISKGGQTMVIQTKNQTYVYRLDAAGKLQLTQKMPYNNSQIIVSENGQQILVSDNNKSHHHKLHKEKKKFVKVGQLQASGPIIGSFWPDIAPYVIPILIHTLPAILAVYKPCTTGQWSDGTTCFNCSAQHCDICSSATVCSHCLDGFDLVGEKCELIVPLIDNRTWILGIIFIVFLIVSLVILIRNTTVEVHNARAKQSNGFKDIQNVSTIGKTNNQILIE